MFFLGMVGMGYTEMVCFAAGWLAQEWGVLGQGGLHRNGVFWGRVACTGMGCFGAGWLAQEWGVLGQGDVHMNWVL